MNRPNLLPVAPLEYSPQQHDAWRRVVRIFAGGAVAAGVLELFEMAAQISVLVVGRGTTMFSGWRNAAGIVLETANGVAAVVLIVAAVGLARLRRPARIAAIVAAVAVIGIAALRWGMSVAAIPAATMGPPVRTVFALSWLGNAFSGVAFPAVLVWFLTRREVRETFRGEGG